MESKLDHSEGTCAKSLQLCLTLCNPTDCGSQALLTMEFLGKNTGVVAVHLSRGSSQPRARTCVYYGSCIAGRFFTTEPPGKALEGTLLLYFKYLASLDCTYYHWSKNTKY